MFGAEVAIDHVDGSIFVSAPDVLHNERDGSLYRFAYVGGAAPDSLAERFRSTEGSTIAAFGDLFGQSFELSGDVLAVSGHLQTVQGVTAGATEIYRRGAAGWRHAGRLAFQEAGQPIYIFGTKVALDDGRVMVSHPDWRDPTGTVFGRCYVWEISSATEICALPGDESEINVCRQTDMPRVVDVPPGMSPGLCIQNMSRLAPPMAVTAGQRAAIFTDLALGHNAGPGFGAQAFYLRSNASPRLMIGPDDWACGGAAVGLLE